MDTFTFIVLLAIMLLRFCVKYRPEPSERNFDNIVGPVSFDGGGPVVDTRTLVVGQDVYMSSGCYWNEGKVVKVTPSGVDVQTVYEFNKELLHFDANGRSRPCQSEPPRLPRLSNALRPCLISSF